MQIKPYPKYRDSGIDWIGDIPEGWQVRRFSSFGFFSSSGINKKTEPNESLVKMVNYTDIYGNDSLVIDSKRDLMTVSCPKGKIISCDLKKGDIVFTPSSETEEDIGLSAVIFENLKNTVFSYHVIKFRTITKINLHYKKYIGNNHFVLSQFSSICKGTTRQILTHNDFKSILTILPPFPEQITIANFLDKKITEIDKLIEKDKKLIGLLREKRAALINHAVTKGLPVRRTQTGLDPNAKMKDSGIEWIGEIPEGWEVRKVSKSFDIIGSGTTPKSQEEIYYDKGDISWVITGDLNDGLLKETSKKITKEAIKDYSMLKMYPKNSLIIAMYGATIGKIALLNIEACTNQACCVLAKSKIFETKYVFYWFIANKNNIISYSYGGGQPNISQDVIKTLKIPIPPKPEQKAIVEHLDKATEKIDKTIQKIEEKIKLLEEYKKSLIHHTVTGKIDVRGFEY